MRRARGEPGAEIILQFQPLIMVANLPAPTANPQVSFEMMQAFEQPAREEINPGPNQKHHDRTQDRPVPIGNEGLTKKVMGNFEYFRQPRKRDKDRKANRLNPQD